MDEVASFIGLDPHEFLITGMYNNRAKRGYDALTPWDEVDQKGASDIPGICRFLFARTNKPTSWLTNQLRLN